MHASVQRNISMYVAWLFARSVLPLCLNEIKSNYFVDMLRMNMDGEYLYYACCSCQCHVNNVMSIRAFVQRNISMYVA